MVLQGLPRPVLTHAKVNRGIGLGGASSLVLPDGSGWIMTAIVQFAPPAHALYRNSSSSSSSSSSYGRGGKGKDKDKGSGSGHGCAATDNCPASSCCPSWCRVGPGNHTSVVVFKSTDAMHWEFLSVLADAADYPASHEGRSITSFKALSNFWATCCYLFKIEGPISVPKVCALHCP